MEDASGRSKLAEFENVITEFQDKLFRFAFFRTGNLADSQDIVQEVFLKMFRQNGVLDSVTNIRNYLFRSISNACIDYQRTKKKNFRTEIETASIPGNLNEKEASHAMLLDEEYKRIEGLLKDLPDEQSEIIRLRVLDNLGFAEIAEVLEIPVTTAKSRFKYGIDKLRFKIIKSKEVNYGL